ncbi:hypothetical protein L0P88_09190 [Muricauda sp. SCSIO 64092]|uniref:hypothetical protein n=1 Tax=Allomuricauda sp. SCSIO 64092 TaxID=2908842 RepID=UPI001FF3D84B|nr:hypothetical protein [Muricauda sp. SCSIO 64092]UOY08710.1 hypothetical protein L0P88_09190 [Muricauda sp. SCSIO 64092]
MKLKKIIPPFLVLLVVGCNSDDGNAPILAETTVSTANFIAIGQDLENVYQYTFDGATKVGEQVNLTQESSIARNYITLREVDDLLSFYFFRGGSFSLIIKDVRTGDFVTYSDFFANSPERSVAWGTNNASNVFLGFFGPFETRNLGIQDVDLQNSMGQDITIDADIDFVYQPVLFNDKVYFAYQDNRGDYKFTFYDTDFKVRGPILNFNTVPISFLISESGNIAIIKNGVEATLELYDPNSLGLVDAVPLMVNTAFAAGPVEDAVFDGGVLYYDFPYTQPAKFSSGPALFDTTTQENELVDLFGIVNNVERELGEGIRVTTQHYDTTQDIFLLGYGMLDGSTAGGVLQISKEGELVANILTDFVPTYFVRN